MASIRKRGNTYFIDYHENGKRVRRSVGPSRQAAEDVLKQIQKKLSVAPEVARPVSRVSLGQLITRFQEYISEKYSPNTQQRYQVVLQQFLNFLKNQTDRPLVDITNETLVSFRDARQSQNVKPRTINAEIQILRLMFKLARQWGMHSDNPAEGLASLKIEREEDVQYLSRQDARRLLQNCSEWFVPVAFLILNTGLRKGEIETLLWEDVDLDNRLLYVRNRNQRTSAESEREIPINDALYDVLVSHRRKHPEDVLVFTDKNKNPIHKNLLRDELKKAALGAGLNNVTQLKVLRQTFAAQLVMQGVALKTFKELMGYNEAQAALRYEQMTMNSKRSAVAKIDFGFTRMTDEKQDHDN